MLHTNPAIARLRIIRAEPGLAQPRSGNDNGKPTIEWPWLLCRFDRSDPCEVVGNFVTKRGRAIFYHGRFRSRQMRRWFEEHAPRGGD